MNRRFVFFAISISQEKLCIVSCIYDNLRTLTFCDKKKTLMQFYQNIKRERFSHTCIFISTHSCAKYLFFYMQCNLTIFISFRVCISNLKAFSKRINEAIII